MQLVPLHQVKLHDGHAPRKAARVSFIDEWQEEPHDEHDGNKPPRFSPHDQFQQLPQREREAHAEEVPRCSGAGCNFESKF